MLNAAAWRIEKFTGLLITILLFSLACSALSAKTSEALVLDTVKEVTGPVLNIVSLDRPSRPADPKPGSPPASSPKPDSPGQGSDNNSGRSQPSTPPAQPVEQAPSQSSETVQAPVSQADSVQPVSSIGEGDLMADFKPASDAEIGASSTRPLAIAEMPEKPVSVLGARTEDESWTILGIDWQWWFVVCGLGCVTFLHLVRASEVRALAKFPTYDAGMWAKQQ